MTTTMITMITKTTMNIHMKMKMDMMINTKVIFGKQAFEFLYEKLNGFRDLEEIGDLCTFSFLGSSSQRKLIQEKRDAIIASA